ncbi:galactoside-binding lectin domain-containing protein [Ditylenchus destructor]|nr:galactoside-binding lectin domain-containing protein [Ditylenchus destructor]
MATHEQDYAVPVPYTSRLLAQIQPGQSLVIHGEVAPNAQRFEVNLLNDCTEINPNSGTVPLHVSVRFDEGKIVFNSFLGAEWGKEERHSNPFSPNEKFDLRIRVHDDKCEIFANQKHVADFKHRAAFNTVDHLQVKGDVSLSGVHWGGRYFSSPFDTQFHGDSLRSGQRVFVYGIPKGDFSVNFVGANEDILFHFNVRLGEKAIVRNTQMNQVWGKEEREGPFPFHKGTAFDLVIHNEPYSLQLFCDGKRVGTYAHRTPNPDADYKTLRVMGDVEVTGVEVSHN